MSTSDILTAVAKLDDVFRRRVVVVLLLLAGHSLPLTLALVGGFEARRQEGVVEVPLLTQAVGGGLAYIATMRSSSSSRVRRAEASSAAASWRCSFASSRVASRTPCASASADASSKSSSSWLLEWAEATAREHKAVVELGEEVMPRRGATIHGITADADASSVRRLS